MKILFTIWLTIISNYCFAQFAIINDKDGFSNVKSSAEKSNNIIDKLENGHLVYCFPDSSNWMNIDYFKNNKELDGIVYKDRIIFVDSYTNIPDVAEDNNKITLKRDSIKIVLITQKFSRNKHKFTYHKPLDNKPKDLVELIDNKKYWGTDGEVPKSEYKSIEISLGERKILLPKKAIENLYEPSFRNTKATYDKANDTIYIQSSNSDGAGGYEVIWRIEKGVYRDRFVAYGF